MNTIFSRQRRVDATVANLHSPRINVFLFVLLVSLGIGLVMMTSASMEIASGLTGDPLYFAKRQVFFALLGLVAAFIALHVKMHVWFQASTILLCVALVLLVLVLIPGVGTVVNGSARWIDLGFYRLQPSEMAKLFMVLYMASYLARHRDQMQESWVGFMKPIVILAVAIALLHFEPDHGAMVILTGTTFAMLFLAGARLHRVMLIVMICIGAVVALAVTKPYVINRLTSFLNPWAAEYVYGDGYQLTQALIAFGRGGWIGTGLGNSLQKLYFLPEAHTDFVLSIVAEELGVLGVLVVAGLFVTLVARALWIGRRAERQGGFFAAYVAYGIGMLFATQVFINFGVNTGLLPTKGLTLPFLSYGGNSLLVSCLMVGILMRIEYELDNGLTNQPQEADV